MSDRKVKRTDLGLIFVLTYGRDDYLCLATNNVKICSVTRLDVGRVMVITEEGFKNYPNELKVEAFRLYLRWKTKDMPVAKMPAGVHGFTGDGRKHPWRKG
jgi:hypothetical protein